MSAHAFLAPSSAGKWGPGGCPASARMEAQYPELEDSPEAMEGTAAHFVVSERLLGRTPVVGALAPNGHPIDIDMVRASDDFIRDIQDTVAAAPGRIVRVEERVDMSTTVHPKNWGTPDAYIVDVAARTVFLWDYKYGHRYVDVFRNQQCLDYVAGVLECHGVPFDDWKYWKVFITIYQPRNYHPSGPLREWELSGVDLQQYVTELKRAAELATDPDAEMKTGDYCIDCSACSACPAAHKMGMALATFSMRGQPIDLPPDALSFMLKILGEAEARIKAVRVSLEETALGMVRSGASLPFQRGEYSYGREKWTLPPDAVFAYGATLGMELRKPAEPITPAQARALKKVDPALINMFAEKPRGALTLVPFDSSDVSRYFK